MFPFTTIPIDLPPIVLLHAVGLSLYGARTVLQSPRAIISIPNNNNNNSDDNNNKNTPAEEEVTNPTTTTIVIDDTLKGLLLLGIGLSYLVTGFHVPAAQNTWLYASVPLRLCMAVAAGVRLGWYRWHYGDVSGEGVKGVEGEGRLEGLACQEEEAKREMWMLVLADGVLGVVAGLVLGRFDGRLPGASC